MGSPSQPPAELGGGVKEQQGRQMLDLPLAVEFFSQTAADIAVEKLHPVSPVVFEPIHDGPGRLATQSEIRIEVQETDFAGAEPLGKFIH